MTSGDVISLYFDNLCICNKIKENLMQIKALTVLLFMMQASKRHNLRNCMDIVQIKHIFLTTKCIECILEATHNYDIFRFIVYHFVMFVDKMEAYVTKVH